MKTLALCFSVILLASSGGASSSAVALTALELPRWQRNAYGPGLAGAL
jgi:hypothetical protein